MSYILMQNERDYGNLFDTVVQCSGNYAATVDYVYGDRPAHYPVPAIRVVRDIEFQYDRTIAWYVYPGGHWGFKYLATR